MLSFFQGSWEKEGSRCCKRKKTFEARGCKEKAQRSQTADERGPGKEEVLNTNLCQEKEVWEKEDEMESKDFDLEHYFRLHDVDKSGKWNRQEVANFSWLCRPTWIPGGGEPDVEPWGKCASKRNRPHSGGEKGTHDGKVDAVLKQFFYQSIFQTIFNLFSPLFQVHLQAWRPWRWRAARL